MPANNAALRPLLRLHTLSRGDGLLGLIPAGKIGPRPAPVTVAQLCWSGEGLASRWADMLASTPAQAQALGQWLALGMLPISTTQLQWRATAALTGPLWTLAQETQFADFLADHVPDLQNAGWQVEVMPGFAHQSRPISAWHLELQDGVQTRVPSLKLERRMGSWLLSLGVDVDGERLDLAPILADLLKRDPRWLSASALAEMDDAQSVRLRAPGGRHLHCEAGPLKRLMQVMLDLINVTRLNRPGIPLNGWDADRLAMLDEGAARWHIHGAAGLLALRRQLHAAGPVRATQAPPGLGLTLRPYQVQGLAWLQHLRAQGLSGILADDMGLGKTAQVLAHVWSEKLAGRLPRPALVLAPSSLLFNWAAEAARITPALRVLTLQGPERAAQHAHMQAYDLVLCPYALLWRDIRALSGLEFPLLILDEAQWVKNAQSRTARALRRLRSGQRIALSGTPLENHLGELWAQFDVLIPGLLGDARSFAKHWRKPIEDMGCGLRAQLLKGRIRPFILRRLKSEVASELPPLTELTHRISLQGRQRELYESVRIAADHLVRRLMVKQGLQSSTISVLDALLKLRQVCCEPRLLADLDWPPQLLGAKLIWLQTHLPDLLAAGRQVLVFSQFARLLALVSAALPQIKHLVLTGATPPAARAAIVAQFQNQEAGLMLMSLRAGGVGLNLTAADTVIHLDPWWNPAVQAQASARAHRIGQQRPVFIHQLIVSGSIEERMLELQARKRHLVDGVLGSDADGAAKFSAPELAHLLAPLAPEEAD